MLDRFKCHNCKRLIKEPKKNVKAKGRFKRLKDIGYCLKCIRGLK